MNDLDIEQNEVTLPTDTRSLIKLLDEVLIPEVSFDYSTNYAEALYQQGRRSVVLELKRALELSTN